MPQPLEPRHPSLNFLWSSQCGVRDGHRLQLLGGETGERRPYGARVTEFGRVGSADGLAYVQAQSAAKDESSL